MYTGPVVSLVSMEAHVRNKQQASLTVCNPAERISAILSDIPGYLEARGGNCLHASPPLSPPVILD